MSASHWFRPGRLAALALALGWHGLSPALAAPAPDPFAAGVRTTEPLPAAAQRKAFRVPVGFDLQLVAQEPYLHKPMNLAFDAAGRLWVTTSVEYPFAATNDAPRDRVLVFEDFSADGRARKVTPFAEGLNIPIGIYPFRSPRSDAATAPKGLPAWTWKCVVWSIPHIWLLEDRDGDGRADRREVLFGPFDHTRDTHGNQASFRRGFDGWLYATHGFNNHSVVAGRDGHTVDLHSGNTYRMRLDGTRLEHHTRGQVNPFGMCFDAAGNLFTADCHSSPIYQLIRGACYPSFGKPHDGLGFAPTTIQHSHGSTAIAGIVALADDTWPAEFRDNLLIGNVMTSRINRDALEWRGASSQGVELGDFLTSDDPWFRPVDLQLGPDGALYVADFYNRIIGHYEVPLTHPGRDRERGRIWRIVPRGEGAAGEKPRLALATDLPGLLPELGAGNLTRRMLAMNDLVDRFGPAAAGPVRRLLASGSASPLQRVHGLWVLHRLNALDRGTLAGAAQHRDPLVRLHAQRILGELPAWRSGEDRLVRRALGDESPAVQRAALEALGRHPEFAHVAPLLEANLTARPEDPHLAHTARIALRDVLAADGHLALLQDVTLDPRRDQVLIDLALAVPTADAAAYLLARAADTVLDPERRNRIWQHAARHAPPAALGALADEVQAAQADDLAGQLTLFQSVLSGLDQRAPAAAGPVPEDLLPPKLRTWGTRLAQRLLAPNPPAANWTYHPLDSNPGGRNPWTPQERPCADGVKAWLTSSFPLGESLTGALRSPAFRLPARLSFYLGGHDGFPGQPATRTNWVRLRDAATGAVLMQAAPPRQDTAVQVVWDLAAHAGGRGYVEAVDGHDAPAYAWLAFGRFEPALPELQPGDPAAASRRLQAGAELARRLELREFGPQLAALAQEPDTESAVRAKAAAAVASFQPDARLRALAGSLEDAALPEAARRSLATAVASGRFEAAATVLLAAPARAQQKLAQRLAGTGDGAEWLLQQTEGGRLSPRVLAERAVREALQAQGRPDTAERLNRLTAGLPPEDTVRQRLIEARRQGQTAAPADRRRGAEVFQTACAACHQLQGQGALVGPQLDGIGQRGLERLLEDILDPNRNVDHAFRVHTVVLRNGDTVAGLPRREEGGVLVLANAAGQEVSVRRADIQERRETGLSLMPDNFGEALSEADLRHLLAFLLQHRGTR